jgi:hypothetical protein
MARHPTSHGAGRSVLRGAFAALFWKFNFRYSDQITLGVNDTEHAERIIRATA